MTDRGFVQRFFSKAARSVAPGAIIRSGRPYEPDFPADQPVYIHAEAFAARHIPFRILRL